MHEFETFVYLDVQKTGSTFLSNLLQQFCSEKEIRFKKHGRVAKNYDPDKLHIVTVRNPLDQYISLYSHGCSGKGGLYHRLRSLDLDDLYDSSWQGFRQWLRFIFEPENAGLLDADFAAGEPKPLCDLIGFQTYRYLELAMRDPLKTLYACKTHDDLRDAYKAKNIVNFTIRHETFDADVETLLTTKIPHAIKDLDAALAFLHDGLRLNASDRVDRFVDDPKLGRKSREMLEEREWFLHELFGY